MDRDGAADLAPYFDTVFSRRDAGDVDARSARALDDVLHGTLQRSVLHEVNASIPCDGGLKHDETSGGREPFDLRNVCATRCSPGITNQTIQAVDAAIKAAPLNDGPASEQAGGGPIKQRKEVGKVLKTVVRQVDEHSMGLTAEAFVVLPCSCVLANHGRRRKRTVLLGRPSSQVLLEQGDGGRVQVTHEIASHNVLKGQQAGESGANPRIGVRHHQRTAECVGKGVELLDRFQPLG